MLIDCRERVEGKENLRERNIDEREKHQLLSICTPVGAWTYHLGRCPDQESNLWPFGLQDDTPTNRVTLARAKSVSFLHCMFLALLWKIICPYTCGFISDSQLFSIVLCVWWLVFCGVFLPTTYCFDYCSFVVLFEIEECVPLALFIFSLELLWLFWVFCNSIQIWYFFVLFLWKMLLGFWLKFHYICILIWVIWLFYLCWLFQSMNLKYLHFFNCLIVYSVYRSFRPLLSLFLGILFILL